MACDKLLFKCRPLLLKELIVIVHLKELLYDKRTSIEPKTLKADWYGQRKCNRNGIDKEGVRIRLRVISCLV